MQQQPPPPHPIFVSLNQRFIDCAIQAFGAGTDARAQDVAALQGLEDAAFLSPANSLGFMDGGIDKAYSQVMWPGVEQRVKARIRAIGHEDFIGRPYLPIGSATAVEADSSRNQWLISAPTMLLPQAVQDTRNAYWAMLATLRVVDQLNRRLGGRPIRTLVATSLCCGWGKMDEAVAAQQMREAWDEWLRTRGAVSGGDDTYFDEPNLQEQTEIYQNLDFKRAR